VTVVRTVKKKRTLDDDLKLLEFLVDHDVKDVGRKFTMANGRPMTETAARSWLYRIRKRISRLNLFVGRLRTLQRNSPRIRKLTTDGSVERLPVDLQGWNNRQRSAG